MYVYSTKQTKKTLPESNQTQTISKLTLLPYSCSAQLIFANPFHRKTLPIQIQLISNVVATPFAIASTDQATTVHYMGAEIYSVHSKQAYTMTAPTSTTNPPTLSGRKMPIQRHDSFACLVPTQFKGILINTSL